jgi:hypothetical protein
MVRAHDHLCRRIESLRGGSGAINSVLMQTDGNFALAVVDDGSVYRSRSGSLATKAPLMTSSLCEVYRLVAEEYDVPSDVRTLASARRRAQERRLAALTGERRLAAIALSLRRKLAPVPRFLLEARPRCRLPIEVAAAFPELARTRAPSN